MAKHLARIHGTEEDKVNCPFYFKIGACRHSDRCSRLHHKPAFSPTLLIKHLYRHPLGQQQNNNNNENEDGPTNGHGNNNNNNSNYQPQTSPEQQMEDFLVFFEDMYMELSKFGKLEGLHVCDNLGDHMIGHVYVKYYDEEDAADALGVLNGRYYDGVQMNVEYSPVTDFREARCRDYDEETCSRGGFCNFLHAKPVPIPLLRSLEDDAEDDRQRHLYNTSGRGSNRGGGGNGKKRGGSSSGGRGGENTGPSSPKRKRDKKSSKNHKKSSSGSNEKRRSRSNSGSSTSTNNNNNNDDEEHGKDNMNEDDNDKPQV